MEVTSVSRRYAGALFDIAGEQGSRDAVRSDCAAIVELYDSSQAFSDFVLDPTIPLEEAGKAVDTLFGKQAHASTLRFLQFLVSRKRLDQLRPICEVYEQLICEDLDIIKAEVTTAHALSDAQMVAMKEKLEARYNKQVETVVEVDPSLIGGIKIKVGDHIRDFSIVSQLNRFEESVINAKHEYSKT